MPDRRILQIVCQENLSTSPVGDVQKSDRQSQPGIVGLGERDRCPAVITLLRIEQFKMRRRDRQPFFAQVAYKSSTDRPQVVSSEDVASCGRAVEGVLNKSLVETLLRRLVIG